MADVAELRTAHTADLDPADLKAARALLDEVFNGGVTEADWEHALGGMHALVWDGPALIGHGSVEQRRILHQGRALRAGYVEAVAGRAGDQRQGHGGRRRGGPWRGRARAVRRPSAWSPPDGARQSLA